MTAPDLGTVRMRICRPSARPESDDSPVLAWAARAWRALEAMRTNVLTDDVLLHEEDCPACGGDEADCACSTKAVLDALAYAPPDVVEAARGKDSR